MTGSPHSRSKEAHLRHLSAAETPRVIVCAGGGGVGKTTTSAALALALARNKLRTLIVTIDPARRLAGALSVPISDTVTQVNIEGAEGRLFALMPDPRRSMKTFVDQLFEHEKEARDRLFQNRVYQGLADAAAGVHELVALNLITFASNSGAFDVVVIDTSPSRQAVDFVTLPLRLTTLLGGRTVTWLAGLAARGGAQPVSENEKRSSGGLLGWGTGRVESLVARVSGPTLVRDTAGLFMELSRVRERFLDLTERAKTLLLGPKASYVLVLAPTHAARDDVLFLAKKLEKLGCSPRALLMNRADTGAEGFISPLLASDNLSPALLDVLNLLEDERKNRSVASDMFSAELLKALPKTPLLRLPHIERATAVEVIYALSAELEKHHHSLLV